MSYVVLVGTFLAASVEWVEAMTIVLAVGMIKGWRSALVGTAAALALLGVLVITFGTALAVYAPVATLRTLVGLFLLLFGIRWLHKAILRSAGVVALHDEAKAFEETEHILVSEGKVSGAIDWVGASTSFNGVFLEGAEVVFIVIALVGLTSVPVAATGALLALVVVVVVGVAVRHPLTRIPENTMKYVVGVMLTTFGTFFAGEGLGVVWWRSDLSVLPLMVAYAVASFGLVQLIKNPIRLPNKPHRPARMVRAVAAEVWGLFVGDGSLAILTITAVLAVGMFNDRFTGDRQVAGPLLAVGVLGALLFALSIAASSRRKIEIRDSQSLPPPEPLTEEAVILKSDSHVRNGGRSIQS
jgi:uncharacterized membrane protein